MATIAELQTKLTIDDTNFKRGISNAEGYVSRFSNKAKIGMTAVGALVAGGVVAAFSALNNIMKTSEERVSKIVDTATRLGAGIPELQRLQYAANQSGIGTDTLNTALGRLLKLVGAAKNGNEAAGKAFRQLGLDANVLATMGIDQQYIAIADAIKKIPDPAQQAAAAFAVFGKSGITQLSLLKDDVRGLVGEFKGLGIELTGAQAKGLEQYGDSVKKLDTVWEGFKSQLAASLAGPLKHVLDWIVQSSINMGGLGSVAQAVAASILSMSNSMVGFFGAIYRGIQSSIIAAEELLKLLLRISQVGTLGLSNINLPGGLGGAGDKIQELQKDINQRSANIINSQATQQKIQVEIKAASGFVAEVVNSPENTVKINNTLNNAVESAARGA